MTTRSAEFGIEDKECYFCHQNKTIRFSEHYTFCPNCSAIYTYYRIVKSTCEHIKGGIPFADRLPCFESLIKTPCYIRVGKKYVCNTCQNVVKTNGW